VASTKIIITMRSTVKKTPLPHFSTLNPDTLVTELDHLLQDNRQQITAITEQSADFTWENLVEALDTLDERLQQFWSPVSHMNAVMNSEKLRIAYQAGLEKISRYSTEIGQNTALYQAFVTLKNSEAFNTLDGAQQQVIRHTLRDFKLSGVGLPEQEKKIYQQARQKISELANRFEQNVLDASNDWTLNVAHEKKLAGLPEHAKQIAATTAQQKQQPGWTLTLQFPCYHAVMTYADDRSLRQTLYKAWITRASEYGDARWDNSRVMVELLQQKQQIAQLLGFSSYAEFSLANKMAETPQQVLDFLEDLARRSRAQAQQEFSELSQFAEQQGLEGALQPWDIAYYSEKLCQQRYHFSQEALRPYFSEQHVLEGLFTIIEKLYAIQIKPGQCPDVWHKDVQFFTLYDANQNPIGHLYMDLYARSHKRGGAWMDECVIRRRHQGQLQQPVAYLTCNFAPASADKPPLLVHDEVVTLFHEMGHCLHHLLTEIDYPGVSGINGIPWDAVELPSQFFENWCWQPEALKLMACHYETGAPLAEKDYQAMIKSKNFQSALQMLRQVEFALFDFKLHHQAAPENAQAIQQLLDDTRHAVSVVPIVEYNRFQHSFSHIFAGGYSAGYYSYKWAELLACDAFALFLEQGIFNTELGRAFKDTILAQGGSQEPLALFMAFRGREPRIDALLVSSGIKE
jgi:oligopeptidase A